MSDQVTDGGPPSANEHLTRLRRLLARCHVLARGQSLAAIDGGSAD
ncbi:hypothetical protein RBSWK_03885 [Rhodopirellula baltica SWK14]|uniref:Uncharacterized protein n=1 Tax=Rhodopirellula baltica SWK14 TaxID=993516 RepID=L7CGJ1_RHOBT|nr:hypothetical protein RBSWK_03885 [Rhodopirellula baltica SWK14]